MSWISSNTTLASKSPRMQPDLRMMIRNGSHHRPCRHETETQKTPAAVEAVVEWRGVWACKRVVRKVGLVRRRGTGRRTRHFEGARVRGRRKGVEAAAGGGGRVAAAVRRRALRGELDVTRWSHLTHGAEEELGTLGGASVRGCVRSPHMARPGELGESRRIVRPPIPYITYSMIRDLRITYSFVFRLPLSPSTEIDLYNCHCSHARRIAALQPASATSLVVTSQIAKDSRRATRALYLVIDRFCRTRRPVVIPWRPPFRYCTQLRSSYASFLRLYWLFFSCRMWKHRMSCSFEISTVPYLTVLSALYYRNSAV